MNALTTLLNTSMLTESESPASKFFLPAYPPLQSMLVYRNFKIKKSIKNFGNIPLLFTEIATKVSVKQMTSIKRLCSESLLSNVDLWNKNAFQENTCMSSSMDHQIYANNLTERWKQYTTNISLSLLRNGLGVFSTMNQICKRCIHNV